MDMTDAVCTVACRGNDSCTHASFTCQAVTESLMPIFTIAMSIGVDINSGFTEREATREFQNWLAEDPNNGTFGRYRINADLSIEQVR